ncbi:hypothetical protein UFOVP245_158 [uncultured Caudovirales phage]|uniref:Uncharacterized protein n=1 Tax=uncultured Caudovirales phage TaxID=2100421 RepID=A0A6J7WTL9_9CAUD|nr:hypothetical protein UFOVP245_158 [uncultured Caudovirales phage]
MLPEFIKKFFRSSREEAKETAVAINSQITDAVTQATAKVEEAAKKQVAAAADLAVEATEVVAEKAKKNVKKAAAKVKAK